MDKINDLLFEVSWEVCHKVGGIYTVLSTKAAELQSRYGDNLVFVGPDVWSADKPSPYFKEDSTLLNSFQQKAKLPDGISVRVGRWDIPSSPVAVLVDFQGEYPLMGDVYAKMWEKYGVDSLHNYGDYTEGCAFAVAAAKVIMAVASHLKANPSRVMAHFNEWTTGMGLLWLQLQMPQAATLFTTHATSIGRSICSNGKPLYDYFDGYHGDQMAGELNMEAKHSLEKHAAQAADCFTAVSELTARECVQLLEVRPQVVTPNGFEFQFVPYRTVYGRRRNAARKRLLQIAQALTGKQYPDNAFLLATSGRHEYRNKGIDLFLDSMQLLSDRHLTDRPAVAFVMVPGWVKEPSCQLREALADPAKGMPEADLLTHRLNNEDSDEVLCRMRQMKGAMAGGNVDVIYMPCYLDGADGIVDISYYDLLPGLDATVFPSYYEPWGYTPLESVAFSVPTVTTDKSGFGLWVLDTFGDDAAKTGVDVVTRTDSNYWQAAEAIAQDVARLANLDAKAMDSVRKAAKATSEEADWKLFIKYYEEAFKVACKRRDERLGKK